MHVFIVYCHPDDKSFTAKVGTNFVRGLEVAGHTYEIADLYAGNFDCVMTKDEYKREAFYDMTAPVSDDVRAQQQKINRADAIAFIYPVFWTEAPARLTGWFQRVWTYGFAYGEKRRMKTLKKALFLVTMGGSLKDEVRQKQVEAMKTVMVGDRIGDRAQSAEFVVFDEMTHGCENEENREERVEKFTQKAFELGKIIGEDKADEKVCP